MLPAAPKFCFDTCVAMKFVDDDDDDDDDTFAFYAVLTVSQDQSPSTSCAREVREMRKHEAIH